MTTRALSLLLLTLLSACGGENGPKGVPSSLAGTWVVAEPEAAARERANLKPEWTTLTAESVRQNPANPGIEVSVEDMIRMHLTTLRSLRLTLMEDGSATLNELGGPKRGTWRPTAEGAHVVWERPPELAAVTDPEARHIFEVPLVRKGDRLAWRFEPLDVTTMLERK